MGLFCRGVRRRDESRLYIFRIQFTSMSFNGLTTVSSACTAGETVLSEWCSTIGNPPIPSQRAMRPAKMANNIRVFFIGIDFNGQKYNYYFVLKLSEKQYSSIFSDKEMRQLQNVCANDSIVYNKCNGMDDSPFVRRTIRINGFQVQHLGQCTFPSGFDNLFTFLHNNEPKFSRFTGKLTRKSSKRWTQVAAMPEME